MTDMDEVNKRAAVHMQRFLELREIASSTNRVAMQLFELEVRITELEEEVSGTKAGGKKAAATNKANHGVDFYGKIGAKGGKLGTTGGFFADRNLARKAGAAGGRKSRRGPSVK